MKPIVEDRDMSKISAQFAKYLCSSSIILLFLGSCVSHKQLMILDEGQPYISDSVAQILNLPVPIIQTDDRLLIRVSAFDPDTSEPFNVSSGGGQGGQNNQMMTGGGSNGQQQGAMNSPFIGYQVDEKGNIEFPVIGTVNLKGITIEEAKIKMYELLDDYLVNYSVDVQYLNRRVTVTGEVESPGIVDIGRNRISILEAIQRADGITTYSNTENVMVIRETDGERTFGLLDLNDRSVVNSPFYYVMPNDVIYLQPIKAKTWTTQAALFTSINLFTGLISAAAIIIVLIN